MAEKRPFQAMIAVMVLKPVKVMAESEREALQLADELLLAELSEREGEGRLLNLSQVEAQPLEGTPTLDTYTCFWCEEQSLKKDWGPGHMKCPSCGQQPPAAGDTVHMEVKVNLVYDDVQHELVPEKL